ncbi:MAG: hypothetical protein JRG91_13975, partial [Deltaproteobacteria bacterium]|nr:hypothetical protein [Deltaproteobacteria bacterium]
IPADIMPDGGACPEPSPEPYGPEVSWSVDGSEWPGWIDEDETCTLDSERADEDGLWFVRMTCWTGPGDVHEHSLEVYLGPYGWLPLWEGETVEFRYVTDPIHWINRWFTLSWTDGDVLVGGIDSSEPVPSSDPGFFSPLTISAVGGFCDRAPGDCYSLERQALLVDYEYAGSALVFDSTIGYVGEWGDYTIMVDEAVAYHDIRCTDIPGGWYRAIFFQSMWD